MDLIEDFQKNNKKEKNNIQNDSENTKLKNNFSWKYTEKVPVILNSIHNIDAMSIEIQNLILKQENICMNIDKIINKFKNSLEE
jgi:hypothetical protein